MEQALKTWRLMNSCRDRSDGNRSRSSIPGSFRVYPHPSSPSAPPPPRAPQHTYFNYTHVVAITFHFVLLSLHSLLHCHLRPLCSPALPAACCCRWCSGLRTTPDQPRQFYAHTMKRFSHLSSHRAGPFRLSTPQAESRWPPKRQRISRQNVWFNWFRGWLWSGGTLNGLVWFIVCHV